MMEELLKGAVFTFGEVLSDDWRREIRRGRVSGLLYVF